MKKNAKKLSILLLLAVVACGSYFISGTYAKYSRALSGTDTATVAKFSVSATGFDKTQEKEIDLFQTLKEADTSTNETSVLAGKIAPGTGGKFQTTLKNESEVDVDATITLSELPEGHNIPIEYSFGGDGTIDTWTWKKAGDFTKTVPLTYVGKTDPHTEEVVTIYWRWAFVGEESANYTTTQTTATDTTLGEAPTLTELTTKVLVTFEQAN